MNMPKFAGIKNNLICVVADTKFSMDGLDVIPIPEEFESYSSYDLVTKLKYKNGALVVKRGKKLAKNLRVAFVGNWKMRCGIATYSENLWPEIAKRVGDFKLFIEKNENSTGNLYQIGDVTIDPEKVSACWKRGEQLQDLVAQLKAYDPDVIFIQHEFGLWPNAMYWLSFMNQLQDFRVIVTMHSVFHHRDKTICEAAMPEIVVHLEGAKNVLKNEKKIPGLVHVIPHGCFPCVDKERLWNFYKSDHTVIQQGFGFRYKGWELSIRAVAILKQKYSDVFFTGLFSESPYNMIEHQMYYDELMLLVKELGVEENVAIIRGYQSDETMDSYLRTNKVALFPYTSHPDHEVFGVSGAARVAMSKAIPVITTSVNHFSDVPTIKADTPNEIAIELDKLFSDHKACETQVEKQIEFLENNTWEMIALRYIALFENPQKT